MKRAAIIFLIFMYAFTSTGFAVQADYCCNNLKSVRLILADGAKDKEGCCKVKYKSFKIRDVHQVSDTLAIPGLTYTFIHTLNSCFEIHYSDISNSSQSVRIHAPPLYSATPVYISNCVFKI